MEPRPANNLPRRRLFVGRAEELAAVEASLGRGRTTTIAQASVFGLGGVGKTALAIEVAHRALNDRTYPGGVWWVAAEGKPVDAILKFSQILRRHAPTMRAWLADDVIEAHAVADAVKLAFEAVETPALLVLDNVSDAGWIDLLPGGEVRVLVTTRDPSLALGEALGLGVLSAKDARKLAVEIAGEPREGDAGALDQVVNEELGGLAVAVELVARAVKRLRIPWSEMTRHLGDAIARERLLEQPGPMADYSYGVTTAIDLSIELCERDDAALRLLHGAAVFAPEAVPMEWALGSAALDPAKLEAAEARAVLRDLGLVREEADGIRLSMHRLVHRRVRARIDRDTWVRAGRRGAGCVEEWIEKVVGPSREQMELVETQRAHIDEALLAAQRAGEELCWLRLAAKLAEHLYFRAAYGEALALFQQALARTERLTPEEPGRVAGSLSSLAMVLRDLGQPAEAKLLIERALGIYETTYGPEHPDVAFRLATLAAVLRDLGQLTEAKLLIERALSIHEKNCDPNHPDVGGHLSNLAMVLRDLGQLAEGRPLLERAMRIQETTLGPEHPDVAISLSNLATVLLDLGQPAEARPLVKRALEIAEKTYGLEHPHVAIYLSNLAVVLKAMDQSAAARPLLERALAIAEKMLPPGHPLRTRFAKHLAGLVPVP